MQSASSTTTTLARGCKKVARNNLRLVSHGSVVKTRKDHHQKSATTSELLPCIASTVGKHSSTIVGKTPHQVQRRNERERRRVQAVNRGYEVLAHQLADWEELKNKKLTKAQTLKAAILYIQHMEKLISTNGSSQSSMSFSSSQLAFLDDDDDEEEEEVEESEAEQGQGSDENHQQHNRSSSYPKTSMPSPDEKKPFLADNTYQNMPFNTASPHYYYCQHQQQQQAEMASTTSSPHIYSFGGSNSRENYHQYFASNLSHSF